MNLELRCECGEALSASSETEDIDVQLVCPDCEAVYIASVTQLLDGEARLAIPE